MKKILILLFVLLLSLSYFSFAQVNRWGEFGSSPSEILDTIKNDANDEIAGYRIQETALDGVKAGPGKYKIYNTLEWIRKHISPYLQWMVYIGLTVAVILLIYNGLLMVTGALHEQGKIDKVRGNITNILIGVLILTGFYIIFKLFVAIITAILG